MGSEAGWSSPGVAGEDIAAQLLFALWQRQEAGREMRVGRRASRMKARGPAGQARDFLTDAKSDDTCGCVYIALLWFILRLTERTDS